MDARGEVVYVNMRPAKERKLWFCVGRVKNLPDRKKYS